MKKKLPIQNCHTHLFTGDQVPPYLAKTLVSWPLYYILNIKWLIGLVRSFDKKGGFLRVLFYGVKVPLDKFFFWFQSNTEHYVFTKFIAWVLRCALTFYLIIITLSFLRRFFETGYVREFLKWFFTYPIIDAVNKYFSWCIKILLVVLIVLTVRMAKNLFLKLGSILLEYLLSIIGKNTLALLKRYYNIALLAEKGTQEAIFDKLAGCYPQNTVFTVLPMDFDYMEAGKIKPEHNYMEQLDELKALKSEHPEIINAYVFADPRRLKEFPEYFDTIKECFTKHRFSGIKIYPALGYYPFDKHLLRTMMFACEKEIPIMTHCIKGIIYYRGMKKKEWDYHPYFTETEDHVKRQIKLADFKNLNFSQNFTHPLNFLCLLNESILKTILYEVQGDATIEDGEKKNIYSDYGFVWNEDIKKCKLKKNLKNLKICFGHFGGEDEWTKYLENERNSMQNSFITNPGHFVDYDPEHLIDHWNSESWYSIIRNLMMNKQYPNLYADISFILHDPGIIPLLKSSLSVPILQDKILYGSDFYVVRQNGSDKKLFTQLQSHLSAEELDLITKMNPDKFYT